MITAHAFSIVLAALPMHQYITSPQIMLLSQTKTYIHYLQIYMFIIHIYYMHVCFKMAQSNHRGSSATGKRGRVEGEQWGKTSVMRLKQNAKTNRRGRAEKDRDRERFWRSLIPAVHIFSPTLLLVFLLLWLIPLVWFAHQEQTRAIITLSVSVKKLSLTHFVFLNLFNSFFLCVVVIPEVENYILPATAE